MAKTMKDVLEAKFKSGDTVTVNTVALSGDVTTFSGNIVGLGEDYVTLKRENYEEVIIAMRFIATVTQ